MDVAFFESAACPPLLSPAMFRRVELPALKAILGGMAEVLGHPVPCIIGGDTTPILDAMLETGTGYVVAPYETDQAAFMKKIWDRTDIRVRVNSDVEIISRGPWDEIRADADRIIGLVQGGRTSAWAPAPCPTRRRRRTCCGCGSMSAGCRGGRILANRDPLSHRERVRVRGRAQRSDFPVSQPASHGGLEFATSCVPVSTLISVSRSARIHSTFSFLIASVS